MAQRTELSRCQYPVPDRYRVDEKDCGEPAVAVWTFEAGGQMHVCELHDDAVRESLEKFGEPTPEDIKAYEHQLNLDAWSDGESTHKEIYGW